MNILLVNPRVPETFWSFKHAIRFISKRAVFPPLGLLTVAALLPREWHLRLIDLNIEDLTDDDIRRADQVFIGGMSVQEVSVRDVIARVRALGRPIVAGGPLFTARSAEFPDVDHFVLNEAELTLPAYLDDLRTATPKPRYTSDAWADLTRTPSPRWDLVHMSAYSNMNVQYSRGCPYDCEFCDITVLYGRVPRTKSAGQLIGEFDALADRGWTRDVFLVDDNFIGNRTKLKREILPAIIRWRSTQRRPFTLNTEVSVNLADDEELMDLMTQAGFSTVFVGIESPNDDSLAECGKSTNRRRDLLASVRRMQQKGLQVQGGFILGFDSDPATIFDRMVKFIQDSGIVTAMVGLLNAPVGSKLYKRLVNEGRLLSVMSGDNTDFSMNFIPRMNIDSLKAGYRHVLESIYAPRNYYARVRQFLRTYRPVRHSKIRISGVELKALVRSMVVLGVIGRERVHYWKLFCWSLFTHPRTFPMAITLSIYGFHYRRILEQYAGG